MSDIGIAFAAVLVFVLILVDVLHEYRKASPKVRRISRREVTMIGPEAIERALSNGRGQRSEVRGPDGSQTADL